MSSENIREEIDESTDAAFRNKDAESAIIGLALSGTSEIEDIVGSLSEDDFSYGGSRKVFAAIRHVYERGIKVDAVSVGSVLGELYGEETESKLAPQIVTFSKVTFLYRSRNVKEWVRIVKKLAARRRAIASMGKLFGNLRDPTKDINETLGEISDAASEAYTSDAKWVSSSEVAMNTFEYLERRQKGEIPAITSGVTAIDKMVGGFFGGELTVVAARPAVGKSAFGLNIAISATDKGHKVCFVSCEMNDVGYGQRILSREAWVNGETLRKAEMDAEEWDRLAMALTAIGDYQIDFMFPEDNPNGMTLENVIKSIRQKARHKEVDMLIVDYIGILQTERRFKEDRDRVKYITGELKRLSQVANIPVIALCQVNRDAHGQMPTMAQLRDSGSVEQDADGIIFLHRPENNKDPTINRDDVLQFEQMNSETAYISINVAKQRNGRTGMLNLIFDPRMMRYAEIARMEEQKA